MDIKVSVIMPVYNAEKYLDKSIESMLNQTLKDFELILVNDGSKDNSKDICEKYKTNDSRIKVINKKNEGACIARNTGLKYANGKYIQFVDADDYVEDNMLEEQYILAEKTQAEVVMCGMKYDIHTKKGEIIYEESVYKDMIISCQDDIKPIFMDLFENLLFNYTHNKLYNAEFLKKHSLGFITWLPIDQDTNFNIDVFIVLNRLTITTKSYYHYVKTFDETIVNRYHANKFEVRTFRYNRLKQLLQDWEIYNEENKEILSSMYIHHVIECIDNFSNIKCNFSSKEKLNSIRKIIKENQVLEAIEFSQGKSLYITIVMNLIKLSLVEIIYLISYLKNKFK